MKTEPVNIGHIWWTLTPPLTMLLKNLIAMIYLFVIIFCIKITVFLAIALYTSHYKQVDSFFK